MSNKFEEFLHTLTDVKDNSISAITWLIKLTQNGELAWTAANPSELFPAAKMDEQTAIMFVANYNNLSFYLSERQEDTNTFEHFYQMQRFWSNFSSENLIHNVALGVHDRNTNKWQVFPSNRALIDLLKTVKKHLFEDEDIWLNFLSEKKLTENKRLEQTFLRKKVLEAYNYKCAISGETVPEVLQVAHIVSMSKGGESSVNNNIVLRADLLRLFHKGLITISSNFVTLVSSKITSPTYTIYNGRRIHLPDSESLYPSTGALHHHSSVTFIQN